MYIINYVIVYYCTIQDPDLQKISTSSKRKVKGNGTHTVVLHITLSVSYW